MNFKDNIVSLDIETACSVPACPGKCDHALYPHTAQITCVGLYALEDDGTEFKLVLRDSKEIHEWLRNNMYVKFVGQNFKFDYKHLKYHGYPIRLEQYTQDTQNMASVSITKVTPEYMTWYVERRKEENKKLPKGYSHRNAGPLSLKVLAPFFLKVDPFWENPTNHNNDEYVLKDCEYTYKLRAFFKNQLDKEGLYDFYKEKLMPWTRMITEAECKGITIDLELTQAKWKEANEKLEVLKEQLDAAWIKPYIAYKELQEKEIYAKYDAMCSKAMDKWLLKNKANEDALYAIGNKYEAMAARKTARLAARMNLNSPVQLSWIFKDYYGLDIRDFDDEESTGRQVLNRLVSEGRKDIELFLEYRKYKKLATSFFPTYMELQNEGVLHCSFNPTGTRTGRLSSSGPNLQQVPGHLHALFKARRGYKLITRDAAGIEPCWVAYYTHDPNLCSLLITGGNFHSNNVKVMMGFEEPENEIKGKYPEERDLAKTVGLALVYGAGPYRVQMTAATKGWSWNLSFCKNIFDNLKMEYETAFEFKKGLDKFAVNNPIETYFGRKHSYPDPSDIYMKAFNTLVQSTASDMLLSGSYAAYEHMKENGIDCYPLLWVHDEVVFECREDQVELAAGLIDNYLTSFNLNTPYGNIPLKVEGKVGNVWEK